MEDGIMHKNIPMDIYMMLHIVGEGARERGGIIGGREGVGVRVSLVNLFRGYI